MSIVTAILEKSQNIRLDNVSSDSKSGIAIAT